MKKFLLLIPLFFLSSCSRSVSQMWDDTKTATSYMGRGFQAFFSGNNEEEQIAMNEDVFQISEDDFIPFDDQDLKTEKTMQATQEPGSGTIPTKSEFFTPPSDCVGTLCSQRIVILRSAPFIAVSFNKDIDSWMFF